MRAQREAYEAAGIQHLLVTQERGDPEAWLAGMATIAAALGLAAA